MNKSGFKPFDDKILVKMDVVEEKTSGGIIIPESEKSRKKYAQQKGVIVEMGFNALVECIESNVSHSVFLKTHCPRVETKSNIKLPKVGDYILMNKYTGVSIKGEDDLEYRVVFARDIWALVEKKDK